MGRPVFPGIRQHSAELRALDILQLLEAAPKGMTHAEIAAATGWSEHQVTAAIRFAREQVCPRLYVAIPHPVPDDGYRYHLTAEWISVDGTPAIEKGTEFALGIVDTRLRAILRDVRIARVSLDSRSVNGRKANFLDKHLSHIIDTLSEIGGSIAPPEDL